MEENECSVRMFWKQKNLLEWLFLFMSKFLEDFSCSTTFQIVLLLFVERSFLFDRKGKKRQKTVFLWIVKTKHKLSITFKTQKGKIGKFPHNFHKFLEIFSISNLFFPFSLFSSTWILKNEKRREKQKGKWKTQKWIWKTHFSWRKQETPNNQWKWIKIAIKSEIKIMDIRT